MDEFSMQREEIMAHILQDAKECSVSRSAKEIVERRRIVPLALMGKIVAGANYRMKTFGKGGGGDVRETSEVKPQGTKGLHFNAVEHELFEKAMKSVL